MPLFCRPTVIVGPSERLWISRLFSHCVLSESKCHEYYNYRVASPVCQWGCARELRTSSRLFVESVFEHLRTAIESVPRRPALPDSSLDSRYRLFSRLTFPVAGMSYKVNLIVYSCSVESKISAMYLNTPLWNDIFWCVEQLFESRPPQYQQQKFNDCALH
jgi:hypothetical protein